MKRAGRALEERNLISYQVIAITGLERAWQDTVLKLMESAFEGMESRFFHTSDTEAGIILVRRKNITEEEIEEDFEKFKSYCGSFLNKKTDMAISTCFMNAGDADHILAGILRELETQEIPSEQKQNDLIRQMQGYIDSHYCERITLEEMAGALHANKSYLSRLYKQKTGENLFDTILTLRMEKAKELMQSGEKKIYEIASAVGIEEAAYFSRIFRKATGISPRDYYISCHEPEEGKG